MAREQGEETVEVLEGDDGSKTYVVPLYEDDGDGKVYVRRMADGRLQVRTTRRMTLERFAGGDEGMTLIMRDHGSAR